jgi:hypothetical protein
MPSPWDLLASITQRRRLTRPRTSETWPTPRPSSRWSRTMRLSSGAGPVTDDGVAERRRCGSRLFDGCHDRQHALPGSTGASIRRHSPLAPLWYGGSHPVHSSNASAACPTPADDNVRYAQLTPPPQRVSAGRDRGAPSSEAPPAGTPVRSIARRSGAGRRRYGSGR